MSIITLGKISLIYGKKQGFWHIDHAKSPLTGNLPIFYYLYRFLQIHLYPPASQSYQICILSSGATYMASVFVTPYTS